MMPPLSDGSGAPMIIPKFMPLTETTSTPANLGCYKAFTSEGLLWVIHMYVWIFVHSKHAMYGTKAASTAFCADFSCLLMHFFEKWEVSFSFWCQVVHAINHCSQTYPCKTTHTDCCLQAHTHKKRAHTIVYKHTRANTNRNMNSGIACKSHRDTFFLVTSVDACAHFAMMEETEGFCVHGFNCYLPDGPNILEALEDREPSTLCDQAVGRGAVIEACFCVCHIHIRVCMIYVSRRLKRCWIVMWVCVYT